ncbi:MAG: Fur family ferric uptake transcriptional regulator [Planctomycetota bacterium]|jgi:Fur family ferric uptake transcriptional regulator
MSAHPERAGQFENEASIVEDALRKSGFRWTNQRALIVREALVSHAHFTAEELLELCRKKDPKVSRATVYRTLSVLEDAGFVEGLETGDGGRRFEHVLGHEHHDHMVCLVCEKILEFRDDELERRQELAAKQVGFKIERHSLHLYGTCKQCQQEQRKK